MYEELNSAHQLFFPGAMSEWDRLRSSPCCDKNLYCVFSILGYLELVAGSVLILLLKIILQGLKRS